MRWSLVERFHWTLAEVDALAITDLMELYAIDEAKGKAREDAKMTREHQARLGGKR